MRLAIAGSIKFKTLHYVVRKILQTIGGSDRNKTFSRSQVTRLDNTLEVEALSTF